MISRVLTARVLVPPSLLLVLLGSLAGCVPPSASGVDAPGEGEGAPVYPPKTCPAPEGLGSPQSIDEATALINALPRPVTVPCLLESFDRPLLGQATSGFLSAQPAAGVRSPRFFLFFGPLIVSVVPEGAGGQLVEFAEITGPGRTIKGELHFPVESELEVAAPYETILAAGRNRTNCGLCHQQEIAVSEVPPRFESTGFRSLRKERVTLEFMAGEWETCDAAVEPARCAFLDALFSFGPVSEKNFPEDFTTFVSEF